MVADVTVVGVGVIGLTSALALADRGVAVRLVGRTHHGEASSASGGMLAPSVEAELFAGAHGFAVASRDRYPAFLADLEERTQIPVPLNRLGILEIAGTDARLAELAQRGAVLSAAEVRDLEPEVSALGGVLSPDDGCVDPLLLLDALRLAVARHRRISVVSEDVQQLRVSNDTCAL